MKNYKAPQRDTSFVMDELLGFEQHYEDLGFEGAPPFMVKAIFTESAKFSENILAPLDAVGDDEGCQWNDGQVKTPTGFKDAYHQFVEGGWPSLAQPQEYGGQALPYSLAMSSAEWISSANHSWGMYTGLSHSCMETLKAHGTQEQKQQFLPKLVSGHWTGTMCLTESHCGSDLGMLKTKAVPNTDGSYSITGTKIFISAGEHDMSDNIIHIVLAKLPDAPDGIKGLSLFIVPKFNIDPQGEISGANAVSCGSIEHKMGIKGSATCVMNFDAAKGQLIGKPHRGMKCMFTFMNMARIATGLEGLAATEASFQGALAYAKDRLQFRSLSGIKNPNGPADAIIEHPDVRRMLLTQKAFSEGNRALIIYCMKHVDTVLHSQNTEEKYLAESKLSLLTPIVKAFLTETALEATNHGMQVLGGHGYIKEWGMEQLVRDTRICTMYEGTTGIQALDLLARKVVGSRGELLTIFTQEVQEYCLSIKGNTQFNTWTTSLESHLDEWKKISTNIAMKSITNHEELGAASVDYLMYSGYVTVAFFWLQMAVVAQQKLDEGSTETDFYQAKIQTARFYFERILSRTHSLVKSMESGAENLMSMSVAQFK